MPEKFAIIDVETTGGRADQERVIEIAIAIHDGQRVLDKFESLVQPERHIPYNITRITGITNEMVKDAPKFYEIAKKVVEMTEGAVFVAHNSRFDYDFICHEFKRIGYTYTRKQLCTVKLSRKAFPQLPGGHSLGNLILQLGIEVDDRHRAMADVLATVEVFEQIIARNGSMDFPALLQEGLREAVLPSGITMDDINALPNATGVYYFHDGNGEVVYVGKSIHIRQRVLEHFRGKGQKALQMERHVRSISYEKTGSELVSLLLESHEIRRLQPIINKAQRGKGHPTGIVYFQNTEGYACFSLQKISAKHQGHPNVLATYEKASAARMALFRLKSDYELCGCLLDGRKGDRSCLYQQIGQCAGAGVCLEGVEEYNGRAAAAKSRLEQAYDFDCLILEGGRTADEMAVVLVEGGTYQGFGYVDGSGGQSLEDLKSCIRAYPQNSNVPDIIRGYLAKKPRGVKVLGL